MAEFEPFVVGVDVVLPRLVEEDEHHSPALIDQEEYRLASFSHPNRMRYRHSAPSTFSSTSSMTTGSQPITVIADPQYLIEDDDGRNSNVVPFDLPGQNEVDIEIDDTNDALAPFASEVISEQDDKSPSAHISENGAGYAAPRDSLSSDTASEIEFHPLSFRERTRRLAQHKTDAQTEQRHETIVEGAFKRESAPLNDTIAVLPHKSLAGRFFDGPKTPPQSPLFFQEGLVADVKSEIPKCSHDAIETGKENMTLAQELRVKEVGVREALKMAVPWHMGVPANTLTVDELLLLRANQGQRRRKQIHDERLGINTYPGLEQRAYDRRQQYLQDEKSHEFAPLENAVPPLFPYSLVDEKRFRNVLGVSSEPFEVHFIGSLGDPLRETPQARVKSFVRAQAPYYEFTDRNVHADDRDGPDRSPSVFDAVSDVVEDKQIIPEARANGGINTPELDLNPHRGVTHGSPCRTSKHSSYKAVPLDSTSTFTIGKQASNFPAEKGQAATGTESNDDVSSQAAPQSTASLKVIEQFKAPDSSSPAPEPLKNLSPLREAKDGSYLTSPNQREKSMRGLFAQDKQWPREEKQQIKEAKEDLARNFSYPLSSGYSALPRRFHNLDSNWPSGTPATAMPASESFERPRKDSPPVSDHAHTLGSIMYGKEGIAVAKPQPLPSITAAKADKYLSYLGRYIADLEKENAVLYKENYELRKIRLRR